MKIGYSDDAGKLYIIVQWNDLDMDIGSSSHLIMNGPQRTAVSRNELRQKWKQKNFLNNRTPHTLAKSWRYNKDGRPDRQTIINSYSRTAVNSLCETIMWTMYTIIPLQWALSCVYTAAPRKKVEPKLHPWSRFMVHNSAPLLVLFWCHFQRWSCFRLNVAQTSSFSFYSYCGQLWVRHKFCGRTCDELYHFTHPP